MKIIGGLIFVFILLNFYSCFVMSSKESRHEETELNNGNNYLQK